MITHYNLTGGQNGYQIRYKVCMSEEYQKSGKAPSEILLCIHGFNGSMESLVIGAVAEEMTTHGYIIVSFNLPAHGDSPARFSDLTINHCLSDIETILSLIKRSWPDTPISVFATSMGGYLTVLYLEKHQEFRKVILRSPALYMAKVLRENLMAQEDFASFHSGKPFDFGFNQPLVLEDSFYEDLLAHPIPEDCPQKDKIMIIHGTADISVPTHYSEEYAASNHLLLHEVVGATHWYDHPGEREEIVRLTKDWLMMN